MLVVASYGFKPRNSSSARSIGFAEELAPTLAADGSSCEGGVLIIKTYGFDSYNQTVELETAQPLRSHGGATRCQKS